MNGRDGHHRWLFTTLVWLIYRWGTPGHVQPIWYLALTPPFFPKGQTQDPEVPLGQALGRSTGLAPA